ncbi:MAG: class I poly(R)-hydroxyalkanoic acid synthase [Tepidiphilus sp.]|uniref:PHA/PHB synthase family protein n=1 Tax=Tepidiphilus succinatimandens TaxID=224436 RepID=UPI00197EDAB8|nr:class I poly(R)-hydroxyalkanoic acid synthase [Tepidiphilus succinatimandens]MBP6999507.1 class I poly(R)-hydroxyalkanoic acid synthase [Tepidiphilus sp.]
MTSFPNPPGVSLPPGHPLQAWQQYWQLMAGDPDKLRQWQQQWLAQHAQLWDQLLHRRPGEPAEPVVPQVRGDKRFSSPAWQESPIFDYLRQAYWINAQMLTRWVEESDFPDGKTKARARFLVRQIVDALAPSNFAATNPEFIRQALETQGESIRRGIANLLEDLHKGHISMTDESAFEVGRNLAVTPGAVIAENPLMQLIQYAPLTEKVGERPLLIVPPNINKFYILDLQPENSLVRFALEQGHTVFMISWKNPGITEARYGWDDYLELGPLRALEIVRELTGVTDPNVLGFCVGGTMLSCALAVARARGETPVRSLTLMTTLLDYAESGDLGCLVDEASVTAREAAIGKGGLMLGSELANTFSALRANDLVWNYVVNNYLKGEAPKPFDLLFWNSDSTNLPGPFVTYYLRNMYLENNLRVPNKLTMLGEPVSLTRLDMPAYVMAAREDHIVPWRGAYLSQRLLGGPRRFVLGASGHIAGAINPARKNRRSYWTNDSLPEEPEAWLAGAQEQPGSWWWDWARWLETHKGKLVPARTALGNDRYRPIEPAPGRYVKEPALPLVREPVV